MTSEETSLDLLVDPIDRFEGSLAKGERKEERSVEVVRREDRDPLIDGVDSVAEGGDT